jgi:hypothetical protein
MTKFHNYLNEKLIPVDQTDIELIYKPLSKVIPDFYLFIMSHNYHLQTDDVTLIIKAM